MSEHGETDIRLERDVAAVNTKIEVVSSKMEAIQADILEIKEILRSWKSEFVTVKEFEPIKRGFYGLIAAVVIEAVGVIGALVVWLLTR